MYGKVLNTWNNFWFEEGSPKTLAIFRILLGLYWLIRWLIWSTRVELQFSVNGLFFPLFDSPRFDEPLSVQAFLGFITENPSIEQAWIMYSITGLSLIGWLVGYYTRLNLIIFQFGFAYHYLIYMHSLNSSFDRILFVIGIFLILSPCGKAFSLDSFLKQKSGKKVKGKFCLWTQKAICFHVAFFYFGTGVYKITNEQWKSGEMLYWHMLGEWSSIFSHGIVRLGLPMGIYDLLVIITIFMEINAIGLLFSPKWQILFFIWGTTFHLLLAFVIQGLPHFLFMPFTYILFLKEKRANYVINSLLKGFNKFKCLITS